MRSSHATWKLPLKPGKVNRYRPQGVFLMVLAASAAVALGATPQIARTHHTSVDADTEATMKPRLGAVTGTVSAAEVDVQELEGLVRGWTSSDEDIVRLRGERRVLEQKIEAAEQKVKDLKRAMTGVTNSIPTVLSVQDLENKLKFLENRRDELRRKETELLARIRALKEANSQGPAFRPLAGMKPVYVMLRKGRIIPIKKPYFSFEDGYSDIYGNSATKLTRVKQGDTFGDATNTTGCLHAVFSEINPARQYVALFVCGDSIATFRQVEAVLRDRNLAYSWQPGHDKPMWETTRRSGTDDDWGAAGRKAR